MSSKATDSIIIAALNYIRSNRKVSEEDIREHFGCEGVFVLNVFWARFSDVRKQKDERSIKEKRKDVIDQMEQEFYSGKLKNPVKETERQEMIMKILIGIGAAISAILLFVFGWAVILLVPPIWLIILLIIWIIKKI